MTDAVGDKIAAGLATASDGDYEASHGLSFVALSALMMRRYMHEMGVAREDFAPFAINAHRNAALNANAMFREPISAEAFARSPLVAAPIGVLDAAPVCDGAAAVVICSREFLQSHHKPVRIAAAAGATDTIGLAGRPDLLTLGVAKVSAGKAYAASGFSPKDIDFFEAHDAFTIITALSLEACGFAPRGQALKRAAHGCFGTGGCVPVSTFGGLKARGHPVGASGGVGMQAVQLARHDGARVIAVTSSAGKADVLFEAGAHEVIVSPDLNFAREVRRVTGGQGVDLALEIVGSYTFAQTLKSLAPGGRLVTVGNLETGIVDLNPGLVIVKELEILGAYATTQAELNESLRLVETGAIRTWVSDVLPLTDAAHAHDRLEKRDVAGRLVLAPVH